MSVIPDIEIDFDDLMERASRITGYKPPPAKTASPSPENPYDELITDSATRHGVDPDFIRSMMHQESRFKPRATSHKGASGLMQLMPDTAKRLGVSDIYDPKQNIEAGTKYAKWLLDRFKGNVDLALAGYNAGEGAVDRYGGIPPFAETRDYVKKIRSNYKGTGYFNKPPEDYSDLLKRADAITGLTAQPATSEAPADYSDLLSRASAITGIGATPVVSDPFVAPETPETIQAQAMSALRPDQTERVAILVTPEEMRSLGDSMLQQFLPPVQSGDRLVLVAKNAGRKGYGFKTVKDVDKYITKNGFAKLIGKKLDVGNQTVTGDALVTTKNGKELSSSIVTPETVEGQAKSDKIQFPEADNQIVAPAQDVVAKRLADLEDLKGMQPIMERFPGSGRPETITGRFAKGKPPVKARSAPKSGSVEVSVSELIPQLDGSRAQEVEPNWTGADKDIADDEIRARNESYQIDLRGVPQGQKTMFAVRQAVHKAGRKYGIAPEKIEEYIAQHPNPLDREIQDNEETVIVDVPRHVIEQLGGDVVAKYREKQRENLFPLAEQQRDALAKRKVEDPRLEDIPGLKLDAAITPEEITNTLVTLGQEIGSEVGGVKGGAVGAQVGNLTSSAVGGVLGSSGRIVGTIGGILDFINDLSPTKGESMARDLDPYIRVARPDDSFRDILRDVEETGAQAEARSGDKGIVSQIVKVAGATPGDLSRLILLSRLPGGMITGMALDSAAQTKSGGGSTADVLKSAGHGAALGALFSAVPSLGKAADTGIATALNRPANALIKEGATLGTLAGGTYAVARVTGSDPETAFREAVVNSVFRLTEQAPKLVGKPIRVRDDLGNEVTVKVEKNGEVKTVEAEPVAEVFVPEGFTPKFTQAEKAEFTKPPKMNFDADSALKKSQAQETESPLKKESTAKTNTAAASEQTTSSGEVFAKNKIFTPDKVEAARELLKQKNLQFNSGIDPESFKALATIGAAHIEAGARSFADFSVAMAKDLGQKIEPHLEKLYKVIRDENKFDGMDASVGTSKVGTSIERKAIEKGLTQAFDETAGYDKITVKEQAEKMAAMLQDPARIQKIIAGDEQLPSDIRGGAFIKAVEDAALAKGDGATLERLAKSKLTADTSVHAQEMRMLAERDPDSVVSKLREVQKARTKAAERRYGKQTKERVKREVENIRTEIKKTVTKKQTWAEFVRGIECR